VGDGVVRLVAERPGGDPVEAVIVWGFAVVPAAGGTRRVSVTAYDEGGNVVYRGVPGLRES
jgi:hypothetical protein